MIVQEEKCIKCPFCGQIKSEKEFPITPLKTKILFTQACFKCQSKFNENESDDGSGGGKQHQHNRDARNLQWNMELHELNKTELEYQHAKKIKKNIFEVNQEKEKKEAIEANKKSKGEKIKENGIEQGNINLEKKIPLNKESKEQINTPPLFSVQKKNNTEKINTNTKQNQNKLFQTISTEKQKNNSNNIEKKILTEKNNNIKKEQNLSKERSTLFNQKKTDIKKKVENAIQLALKQFKR